MRQLLIAVLLMLSVLSTIPASASGLWEVLHEPTEYEVFDGADWALGVLSGVFGYAGGAGVGMGIGFLAAGDCVEDPDDTSLLGDCFLHGWAEAGIGALMVAPFGAAGGVYAYGELTDHNGNYWAALAGAAVGSALALTPILADSDAGGTAAAVLHLFLPALGATVGYALSNDTSGRKGPTGEALFVFDGDSGFTVGVPNVAYGQTPAGGSVISSTILSGRF